MKLIFRYDTDNIISIILKTDIENDMRSVYNRALVEFTV